ncbi:MAG TPA: WS/DGAT domain-containing protein [Thermoleophilaceae bacterium]|nr:WS/DGAT domain-containing protein [Thermoleophilaceae bacterium]
MIGFFSSKASAFSYAGEVTVGFMADVAVVPDPQPLVKAFDRELRTLCRGARRRRPLAGPAAGSR